MPRVHCVTRSREKLMMMRGENCMEASVRVISRIAKTMETTVMMEAAMPPRMIWATCGSTCEELRGGQDSSSEERNPPAKPRVSAIASGRTRKPPRRLYINCLSQIGRRRFTCSVVAQRGSAHQMFQSEAWRTRSLFGTVEHRQLIRAFVIDSDAEWNRVTPRPAQSHRNR